MSHEPKFLVIHSQYQQVIVGVAVADTIIEQRTLHKHIASAQLIPAIDVLLANNNLSISNLDALIAHAGPGPFTTLRVVLATANGCGLGSGTPLIGADGLKALGKAHGRNAIILLNAFCDDVYFALIQSGTMIESGSAPLNDILPYLKPFITPNTEFIGNGVIMHRERIIAALGDAVHIPHNIPLEASMNDILQLGYAQWQQQETSSQITPVYLKAYSAHMPV